MNLLILGGTKFVGRAITQASLDRDHTVTLFHRGQTNPDVFPGVTHLHGDRDPDKGDGLGVLEGRDFDAVIDVSCYLPRHARASSRLLAERVGFCCFISTVSVYADVSAPGIDESSPVIELDDPSVEEITGATYGGLKVLCERELVDAFGVDRVCVVRPVLVAGPHDHTDRATHWMVRAATRGRMIAPTPREYAMQLIDARDLASFCVRAVEARITGTYNCVGPDKPLTLEHLLRAGAEATGNHPEVVWTNAARLEAVGVERSELPLWLPDPEHAGFMRVSNERAREAGLTLRPIEGTARDTIAWLGESRGLGATLAAGMDAQREDEVLTKLA